MGVAMVERHSAHELLGTEVHKFICNSADFRLWCRTIVMYDILKGLMQWSVCSLETKD